MLALLVSAGHERDAAMLHGFVGLDRPGVRFEVKVLAHLCDTLPYTCAGAVCVGVALARGRAWRALAAGVLLVATCATTEVVKHLLAHARLENWLSPQIAVTSWPSGHSTAAMTLALCAVLVAPPALRAATALLGGAFAVGVGYAVLVLGWHFPSDVLGGFLDGRAVDVAGRRRAASRRGARARVASRLGAAGALGAARRRRRRGGAGVRGDSVALYTLERPTFVAGALTIALLALALVTAVSAASTPGARPVR